jgi:hypothetical protein
MIENDGLKTELQKARTQQEKVESRIVELQSERQKLSSDLQVARGLVDMNWIDAAVAMQAAREKQDSEKTK